MFELNFYDILEEELTNLVGYEKTKELLEKNGLSISNLSPTSLREQGKDESISCTNLKFLGRIYRLARLNKDLTNDIIWPRLVSRHLCGLSKVSYLASGKVRRTFVSLLDRLDTCPLDQLLFTLAFTECKKTEELVIKDLPLAICYSLLETFLTKYEDFRRALSYVFRFPTAVSNRLAAISSVFNLLDSFGFDVKACLYDKYFLRDQVFNSPFKAKVLELGFPDEDDLWNDLVKFLIRLQIKFFKSYDWHSAPFWLVLSSGTPIDANLIKQFGGASYFHKVFFVSDYKSVFRASIKSEISLDGEAIWKRVVEKFGFYPNLDNVLVILKQIIQPDFYWWREYLERELGKEGLILVSLQKDFDPEDLAGSKINLLECIELLLPDGFVIDLDSGEAGCYSIEK